MTETEKLKAEVEKQKVVIEQLKGLVKSLELRIERISSNLRHGYLKR
jgi:hypothetical protein